MDEFAERLATLPVPAPPAVVATEYAIGEHKFHLSSMHCIYCRSSRQEVQYSEVPCRGPGELYVRLPKAGIAIVSPFKPRQWHSKNDGPFWWVK